MIRETDLPCSDCGVGLFERSVDVCDLPIPTPNSGTVTVAECPRCGAQYYPKETLTELAGPLDETQSGRRGET